MEKLLAKLAAFVESYEETYGLSIVYQNKVTVKTFEKDFDQDAVTSVKYLRHYRISTGEYADPFNKGAVVNKLDFVILRQHWR